MLVQSKRRALVYIALITAFCLLACVATFVRHYWQLKAEAEATFKSRHELISQFVALQRDRVQVMINLLRNRYEVGVESSSLASAIRPVEGLPVWQLEPSKPIAGSLTGMAPLPPSPQLERELHAALALDAQMIPALDLAQEVVWLYYQSVHEFIYIAPKVAAQEFHFTAQLYESGYWLEGAAEHNPARRMILKGPYEDMAGKGWIMTFAQPVYDGDRLLGMVGLDLSVNTLEQLTNVGAAVGESMLISEHDRLIARQSGFAPGVLVHPPLSSALRAWDKGEAGDLWLSSLVVEDELWLVHRLARSELLLATARESIGVWFVVLLLGILAIMSLRLQRSLAEVTRLTRVDPLTQALNRRGFYEAAGLALEQAKRQHTSLAILMVDIDHFKKVNDTYGHAEGDAVLKQLGGYLRQARRPADVFCRWGGEEFIILLALDKAEDALAVAERMRAEGQRTRISSDQRQITLSGGLVVLQPDESLDQAINRADELLYHSKQQGRNRITQG